ncbi:MAG: hypothetical protein WCO84_06515 [bacterium]
MSERKMCEYESVMKLERDGVILEERHEWVPINPQPCCKNCIQRIDENDYGNLIMCGQFHTWLKLDFYCSYWVLRE